jgi:formate dehydrogenase subunit gamma
MCRRAATTAARVVAVLPARVRFVLGAALVVCFVALAAPVNAQQQDAPINPDASVVNEQTLLRQSPRIVGEIDQPDGRARVLIQPAGRQWEYFHEVLLNWLGVIAVLGTVVALAAAYFLLGPLRLPAGRSGRTVLRYRAFERFAHWLTAVSFVVLGVTGLNITFGKTLLLPVIGPDTFSALSEAAKYAHNFTSFAFVLGLLLIIAIFIKDNIPDKTDVEWVRQGGGFIKSRHAPARRFNAGEKLVFWGSFGAGVAVAVSGYLLLFPFYLTNIAGMQIAQGVHGVVAMLFIALILGHIYIGSIGEEGAFEGMWTGDVDFNWAKEHHDLWLEDKLAEGRAGIPEKLTSATPAE